MFERVLVATDFGPGVSVAVEHALALAGGADSVLHFLHVVEERFDHSGYGLDRSAIALLQEKLRLAVERQLRDQAAQVAGRCRAILDVRVGVPAEEIVSAAQRHHVDLIVMGARGKAGVHRLLLGSTVAHVLRYAPCPTLTVAGS
ncbi:MAG: universal stress protein [Planctomycetota bacterium]